MIYRHVHGHSHGSNHLHSRRSRVDLKQAGQVDGLNMRTHEPLELGGYAGQITARANDAAASSDSSTTTIAISVVLPLVAALLGLAYFFRKGVMRRRREEAASKFKSMDFGLQDTVQPKGNKRKSAFFGKEKEITHKAQLSMDMNLSSPYLLPPELHNSRESFNSLAKTLHQSDDPYRPVAEYAGSDVGSLRSFKRGPANRASSIYTARTRPSADIPRSQPLPTSPLPSPLPVAQLHPNGHQEETPSVPAKNEFRFVDDGPGIAQVPEVQEPPAVATSTSRKSPLHNSRPASVEPKEGPQPMVAEIVNERDSLPPVESHSQVPDSLGIVNRHMSQASSTSQSSEPRAMSTVVRPPRKESMPVINAPSDIAEYQSYADHLQFEDNRFSSQHDDDELHMSFNHEQAHPHSAGLGVPDQNNRRLSVGLRPLPPDDFLESEDPEFRANRIRSFYKEYFEDSKADQNRPPMPKQGGYYEDHDTGYMGEAAYFDPETNAFVMPYAQPVTRRAMTPPPNNRRPMPGSGAGPRGPPGPRGPSMGHPMPGGPPGRPRAGSTMSGRGWGPRSPRPGSSASNPRFGGQPKKPLAPPVALNSLPTPSKLKDDYFAITGAIDFAPPPTFKEHASGRSQSPLGERVPYRVNTPVHSPLVSAFDDTPALPSPHLLRKSSTFTGLDFAPPRRFKDPEAMSETGSVRSMHSGISGVGLNALRSGAGRISRLPGDTVFAQAALNTTLKPNWGMRD
ncbi:hypothetical protein F4801DRAFT_399697 [Xylaria longipes]|nr:hypothetical protein F4801DRAFT_399697 [Xylaria longipes]